MGIERKWLNVCQLDFNTHFGTFDYLLTFSEKANLMEILFESYSAIGTVGLSMGITADLTVFGKFVIIALMFIGRVGVLTIGNSILVKHHRILQERDIAI